MAVQNRSTSGMFLSRLRLQPQLDQAADGFGAGRFVILRCDPSIDCRYLLIMHSNNLRLADTRRGRSSSFLWYHGFLSHKTMVSEKKAGGKL
jgi:hypothetical protein